MYLISYLNLEDGKTRERAIEFATSPIYWNKNEAAGNVSTRWKSDDNSTKHYSPTTNC